MNTYMFNTVTTMKAYNNKKWWIDGDIIRTKYIEANTVNEALKKFQEIVENDNYISISKYTLKIHMRIDGVPKYFIKLFQTLRRLFLC